MVCGTRASSFYQVLEREVRTNLVYREFTQVGAEKVPALGPEAVARTHEFIVTIAQEKQVIAGRQMRVYTTVMADSMVRQASTFLDASQAPDASFEPWGSHGRVDT